jgi:hypothetical protein
VRRLAEGTVLFGFLAVVVLVENGGFLLSRFEVGFGPIRGGGGLTVPYIGILSILYEVEGPSRQSVFTLWEILMYPGIGLFVFHVSL